MEPDGDGDGGGGGHGDRGEGGRPMTVTVEVVRQLELRGGQPPWTGLRETDLVGGRGAPPPRTPASSARCYRRGRRRHHLLHCPLGIQAEGAKKRAMARAGIGRLGSRRKIRGSAMEETGEAWGRRKKTLDARYSLQQ